MKCFFFNPSHSSTQTNRFPTSSTFSAYGYRLAFDSVPAPPSRNFKLGLMDCEAPRNHELPIPLEEVRTVVQQCFLSANEKLSTSRARKIQSNVKTARRLAERGFFSNRNEKSSKVIEYDSLRNASTTPKSIFAIPNRSKEKATMGNVQKCPNGLSWVRVRSNMRAADQGKDGFFVPYIGESEKHLNFSNTLAADTFEVDELVPDDISDNEEVEEEDDRHLDTQDIIPSENDKQSNQSSKNMKKVEAVLTVQKQKKKLSERVWSRATMRVALKHIFEVLDCSSIEPIAAVVCDVFGLVSTAQLATFVANIAYRESKYDETDREEQAKKKYRTEMIQILQGSIKPRPSEMLKGDSIPFFICRQCYTYNCIVHGNHTAKPSNAIPDKTRKESSNRQISKIIESKCEDGMKKKCWLLDESLAECGVWWRGVERDARKAADVRALILELHTVFGTDPCRIASSCKFILASHYLKLELTCCRVGYLFTVIEGIRPVESKQKSRRRFRKSPYSVDSSKSKRKKMRMEDENGLKGGLRKDFEPCKHPGPCTARSCPCYLNGVNCEKYCSCNHTRSHQDRQERKLTCANAFKGCSCKSSEACVSNACICYSWKRECDPDLCKTCHDCKEERGGKSCRNNGLLMGKRKRIVVGHSETHGWGAFATTPIAKNEVIGEYVGEIVDQEHADRRGRLYDEVQYSFLFNITDDYALDSTRIGNKLRYCNHAFEPNCEARLMRVAGDIRVGLYAKRDIAKHEELFFDYKYKSGPDWAVPAKDKKRTRAIREQRSVISAMKRATSNQSEDGAASTMENGNEGAMDGPPVDPKIKKAKVVHAFKRTVEKNKETKVLRRNLSSTKELTTRNNSEVQERRLRSTSENSQPVQRPLSVWRGVLRRVVSRATNAASIEHPLSNQPISSQGSDNLKPLPCGEDQKFTGRKSRTGLASASCDSGPKPLHRGHGERPANGTAGEGGEEILSGKGNRSLTKISPSTSHINERIPSTSGHAQKAKEPFRREQILKLVDKETQAKDSDDGRNESPINGFVRESGRDPSSGKRNSSSKKRSLATPHINEKASPNPDTKLQAREPHTKKNPCPSPKPKPREKRKRRRERLSCQLKMQRLIMRRRLREIFGSDGETDSEDSEEGAEESQNPLQPIVEEGPSPIPESRPRKRQHADLQDRESVVSGKRRRATVGSSNENLLSEKPLRANADFEEADASRSIRETHRIRQRRKLALGAEPTSRTFEKVEDGKNRAGQANRLSGKPNTGHFVRDVRQPSVSAQNDNSGCSRRRRGRSLRRAVCGRHSSLAPRFMTELEESDQPDSHAFPNRSRQSGKARERKDSGIFVQPQQELELQIPMVNLVSGEESENSSGSFDPKFT
ncbi:unnamed protein product [Agarophyton chilense]